MENYIIIYITNINDMKFNYGNEAIEPLHIWVRNFGFPCGGTFSMRQLNWLED